MLQDSLSKIKYLIVLAFLLVIPMQANAGESFDLIDQTDTGANRLIYYYDTVGRQTLVQVTNTSDQFVGIHVQVFNAANACEEFDFFTCLTPGDTNVYDVENLPGGPDFSDSNGFVAISIADVFFGDGSFCEPLELSLIGMFRIIDDSGYEYRTNAAWSEDFSAFDAEGNVLNFNDVNGNNLSDVVGITYINLDTSQVGASPFVGTTFGFFDFPQNLIFDDFEQPISCSPTTFTCDNGNISFGHINKGIDNSLPNSQGFPRICNSSQLDSPPIIGAVDAGWLFLPFFDYVCIDPDGTPEACDGQLLFPFDEDIHFVGFLGLNNGDGTGSMDSWMSFDFFDEINGPGPIDELTAE